MDHSKTYQIEIMTINPSYLQTFMQKIKDGLAFLPKLGGKAVGTYLCTLGGAFEIMIIIEYANLQARLDGIKAIRHEGSFAAFLKVVDEGVKDFNVYFVRSSPFHSVNFPVNGHLLLRRYDIKGMMGSAMSDMRKALDGVVEKVMKPSGIKLTGAFLTVFGEHSNCLFVMWDLPEEKNIDEYIDLGFKIMQDATLKTDADNFGDHVVDVSTKLYTRLTEPL